MQSIIQKKLSKNVKIYYLNREKIIDILKKRIKICVNKKKEIKEIILFGSFVKNIPTVYSDIDLILIVKDTEKRFVDRYDDYIDFFKGLGIPIDIFVYTEEEETNLNIPLLNKAKKEGIYLYKRRENGRYKSW